jgi:hypothetical protein
MVAVTETLGGHTVVEMVGDGAWRLSSACNLLIQTIALCSDGLSTSVPSGPKSQPKGAWWLIRSPRQRFKRMAALVRSRIMARSNSANMLAIGALARP